MKKALLVISFGTSYHETCEKNITACEQQLAAAFGDRSLFRAFTSGMIIRKLAQRDGLQIDTPHQALSKLLAAGYDDVAIQSLHVIKGDEYEKIVRDVETFRPHFKRLVLGAPLLSQRDDYQQMIAAIQYQLPILLQDEYAIFMGHGSTHYAFSAYACLDHMLLNSNLPIRIGAVESYPEIDLIITGLKAKGIHKVHLMPLMLVAGDHAINDMASDEEGSWKKQLEQAGISVVPWLQGLGENPNIRQMFVRHLATALNETCEERA
ncbi:MAG: sirohydrochlorin cobaltochelatase [Enterobacteriaceae bacterium]|jgi:sirohydrochlorin cobaltochelatase|nr:sirohydrochlorin cobaltochelatase [Enterobacteriaceae bacterium]